MTNHELQLGRRRAAVRRLNQVGLSERGTALKYRKYHALDRRGLTGQARVNARQNLRRAELAATGLTTKGAERQRRARSPFTGLPEVERARRYDRWYRRQRHARGLTARGTVPKAAQLSATEQAWRALRAGINSTLQSFDDIYLLNNQLAYGRTYFIAGH